MSYPKVISWSYRDGKGLFSSKNDKDFVNIFYVKNKETEDLINEIGFIPSDIFGPIYPNVYKRKEIGFTSRAKSYGKIKNKFQKQYPDLEDKFPSKTPNVGTNLGGLIYSNLSFVSNYVNPLIKEYSNYFQTEKYIKIEAFEDVDFLQNLLDYKPLALIGGEITDYQKKQLPKFLKSLKYSNPELFEKLLQFKKVQDLNEILTPVGKKVKVFTLKPSYVKLINSPEQFSMTSSYFWDSEKIIINHGKEGIKYTGIETLTFVPKEDYVVKVLDEKSVTENTIFI